MSAPRDSVIITVKEQECMLLCTSCHQRVGQPHLLTCGFARLEKLRKLMLQRPGQIPNAVYRLAQSKLRGIYSAIPGHYYNKCYSACEHDYHWDIAAWMHDVPVTLGHVLDIGAAYGTLAAYASLLGAASVTVIDKLPYITPEVKAEFGLTVLLGDIERQEVGHKLPAQYDTIILTEVLEHFNFHPLPTMERIVAALNPGGVLLLSTPDQASWGKQACYFSCLNDMPPYGPGHIDDPWIDGHMWHYSENDLQWLLKAAGLTVHQWSKTLSEGGMHFNVVAGRL